MTKTAFHKEAMRCAQVFDWFCLFKSEHTSIESDEHSDILGQAKAMN
jgi:hypothetical protein